MTDQERQTMREHIVFVGTALENERYFSRQKTKLLQRLLDPEDLGHAVTPEVRKLAYGILTEEAYAQRDKENKK